MEPILLSLAGKLRRNEARRRGLIQQMAADGLDALHEADVGRLRFIDDEEERLLAGGSGGGAVRVGDTVRKPLGPHSVAVLSTLDYLAGAGFLAVPRPLDVDDDGREAYAWIEGEAGILPLGKHLLDPKVLTAVGALLKQFHDATASVELFAGAEWPEASIGPEPHEVICHGDLHPANIIFTVTGTPIAFVDLEHAGPGPRWWDLAQAAHLLVPLARDQAARRLGFATPPDRLPRLVALLDGYGLLPEHRAAFLPWVTRRIEWHAASVQRRAAAGDQRAALQLEEGYLASVERDLAWLADHGPRLDHSLSAGPE